MSFNHRKRLVRLARKYDALIVTDDVYDMLQWPSSPGAPSQVMDRASSARIIDIDRYLDGGPADEYGHAVSNGSFSKIAGPGCRTGWAEATEKLTYGLSQTGSTRSGGSPSQLVAAFLQNMLVTGTLQEHVYHYLQPAYARRYHKLIAAIDQHLLPLGLTMPQAEKDVAGGYFVWLTLPKPLNAENITKRALHDEELTIIAGSRFIVEGDESNPDTTFERDFRICFAWEDEDVLTDAVVRLANVVKRALAAVSP